MLYYRHFYLRQTTKAKESKSSALPKNEWVIVLDINIVWCVKNRNYLRVGYFITLWGPFFANYINIFQKIELPMIILMCLTCLNLIWIRSFDIFFHFLFFSNFVKKNYWKFMTHRWSPWDHFWPFFGLLHENVSKKRGSDSHFKMLSVSKS